MNGPVLHILAGDLWGGREAQLEVQLQAIRKANWDARALLFNAGDVQSRYEQAGIPVVVVPEAGGFQSLVREAKQHAVRILPRLIVAHGYKESIVAWRLAVRLKVPWIAVFHGATEPYPGFAGIKMRLYEVVTQTTVRLFAKRIVCVSRALGDTMRFTGMKRFRTIYNVRTGTETPRPEKDPFPVRPAVLTIGRLVQVKRVDRAIEVQRAVAKSVDSHLYIAGDGPEEENLKRFAAAAPVEFLGFRRDAAELLATCDVLLISSDSEGIPTVLLDAIQYGKPVVSTRVGGIPEVAEFFPDYPVKLLPREDISALAAAVTEFLRSRPEAPQARLAKLEEVFSPARAAREHVSLYRELIGG